MISSFRRNLINYTFHVPFWVVFRHLVYTYSVQPVVYKMTTVTYDVNWCLIILSAESAGHISKWRVPALFYYSRLSAVKCKYSTE
jgi:hypothetical protein